MSSDEVGLNLGNIADIWVNELRALREAGNGGSCGVGTESHCSEEAILCDLRRWWSRLGLMPMDWAAAPLKHLRSSCSLSMWAVVPVMVVVMVGSLWCALISIMSGIMLLVDIW